MTLMMGNKIISIMKETDKMRPGLFVGEQNKLKKVATFLDDDASKIFEDYLLSFVPPVDSFENAN